MTDNRAVARKLSILSRERPVFRGGARVISNGLMPPPMHAILDEIDVTVLKRRVRFRVGDSAVAFLVSGRRLMKLEEASADLSMLNPLVGQELSHDEDEVMEAVVAALMTLAQHEAPVLVEVELPEDAGATMAIGIPVDRLAELLEVDLGETFDPMRLFVEQAEQNFSACLYFAHGVWIGTSDDEELLARLRTIAETQWDRFREAMNRIGRSSDVPRLIVLDGVLEGDLSVTAGWSQDEFAVLAHSADETAEIHRLWRRIFTL